MAGRDRGVAFLEIEARGLRQTERAIRDVRRDLIEELQLTMEEIGVFAVMELRRKAPRRTDRLWDDIRVTGRNRSTTLANVRVGADPKSDEGFPYLGVTRKGRKSVRAQRSSRPARTYPLEKKGRGYNLPHPSGSNPHRASMLRFEPGPPGSGFIYRKQVRAYRPARDWVLEAEVRIREGAQDAIDQFTEYIQERLEREAWRKTGDAGNAMKSSRRKIKIRRL
jgi:hypothetical protein